MSKEKFIRGIEVLVVVVGLAIAVWGFLGSQQSYDQAGLPTADLVTLKVTMVILGLGVSFVSAFLMIVQVYSGRLSLLIGTVSDQMKVLAPMRFIPEGEKIWKRMQEMLARAELADLVCDTTSYWESDKETDYEKRLLATIQILANRTQGVSCVRLICDPEHDGEVVEKLLKPMLHQTSDTTGAYEQLRKEIQKSHVHVLHLPFVLPVDFLLVKIGNEVEVAGGIKVVWKKRGIATAGGQYSRGFYAQTENTASENFASSFYNLYTEVLEEQARDHLTTKGSTCEVCKEFFQKGKNSLWPKDKGDQFYR